MKREEAKQLMKTLSIAYPSTYKNYSDTQKRETMQLYHAMFGEYETPIVVQALSNYIKKNQYPPTPAGLQEQIDLIISDDDSSAELWNLIGKAAANSLYHAEDEYNKLPKVVQSWLGSPGQLKELGMVDRTTLETVVRGQFLKSIEGVKDRAQVKNSLSREVREIIGESIFKQLPFSD